MIACIEFSVLLVRNNESISEEEAELCSFFLTRYQSLAIPIHAHDLSIDVQLII